MNIKVLGTISLGALMLLGGCRGAANTNTANTAVINTNTNTAVVATPTPLVQTNQSAATDTVLKGQVETALKGKGFTGVTVDTTTTPATLRGPYPKGKLAEVIATAQQSGGGKPFQNQMAEAK